MNEQNQNPTPPKDTGALGLPPPRGPWKILWMRLRKNRIAMIGGAILIFLYFITCFAGFLSP